MKDFILNLLNDGTKVSSKRFFGALTLLVMIISYFISIFYDVKIPQFMFDGLMYVVLGMFGGSVLEKFSNKGK